MSLLLDIEIQVYSTMRELDFKQNLSYTQFQARYLKFRLIFFFWNAMKACIDTLTALKLPKGSSMYSRRPLRNLLFLILSCYPLA